MYLLTTSTTLSHTRHMCHHTVHLPSKQTLDGGDTSPTDNDAGRVTTPSTCVTTTTFSSLASKHKIEVTHNWHHHLLPRPPPLPRRQTRHPPPQATHYASPHRPPPNNPQDTSPPPHSMYD